MTQSSTSTTRLPALAVALLALTAAVLALAFAPAARGDSIATTDAFLPAVHVTGATGVFRTDVHIFNPEPEKDAVVDLYFTPADANGSQSLGFRIDPDVRPRETVSLTDVLPRVGSPTGYGILEVRSTVPVIVTSNTYNIGGDRPGTYGQFSPGQPFRAALGFDDSVFGDLYVAGLPNDANHRTNAVIINPGDVSLEAGVSLVDSVGQVYGTHTYVVPPFSMHQLNDIFGAEFASFQPPAGADLNYRLNFFVNLGNGAKILSYVTVTDKRTGDPYLIPGQAMRP